MPFDHETLSQLIQATQAERELQAKQDLLVRETIQALFGRAKSVTVTFHMEDS